MRTKKDLLRLVKPILVAEVVKLESQVKKLEGKLGNKTANLARVEGQRSDALNALTSVRKASTALNALVYAYECQGFFARLFRVEPTTN